MTSTEARRLVFTRKRQCSNYYITYKCIVAESSSCTKSHPVLYSRHYHTTVIEDEFNKH